MSEPSDQRRQRPGSSGGSSDSWERRASDLASEVQRRLIRSSARSVRDELGGQVKKALRGSGERADVWATATTEPPDAAEQPPECAWCPICRAARRMAQAQGGSSVVAATPADAAPKGAAPGIAAAADALVGAARDALVGLDTIFSYRPPEAGATGDQKEEPAHGPDHRS